ncbi:hypothetical protein CLOSYM_03478 [[Clostridium] symbiosum ATCC 14940]|uniref:Secreted protein n=1 Tax=[Clostridium] symbiosum ATCC 14940 TaxID=411472 RepID=A0ABC9TUJ6_CLOSY|nr:hypothetical protein CLOSYM_03478 [[Clostridium] symbiosum ATCC 14940]
MFRFGILLVLAAKFLLKPVKNALCGLFTAIGDEKRFVYYFHRQKTKKATPAVLQQIRLCAIFIAIYKVRMIVDPSRR